MSNSPEKTVSRYLRFNILIPLLLLLQTGLYSQEGRMILRFGYSSSENPAVLIERMTPLMNILAESLDADIEFVHKKTFSEMQKAYINQEIDFGIINAYSLIRILPYDSVLPIASRKIEDSKDYRTYFFARTDSGIETLNDLKGKIVALGDPYSTSSYLIPHSMFRSIGLHPDTDFLKTIIISKQDSLIVAVLNRTADAGVSASFIYNELPDEIKSKLNVFATSDPFPLGPFIVNKNLPADTIEKIRMTLFSLTDSERGRYALEMAEIEDFDEVDVKEYESLKDIVDSLNFN